MLICNIVGARPNFMKMAPIVLELQKRGIPQVLIHTGQHYDPNMSDVFFEELQMPKPDVYLGVGSASASQQIAKIISELEPTLNQRKPSLVLVAGDVNSTLAGALAANKLNIPVGHVEAGLRSFDRSMPEEINRILTDHIADFLFTTEESANENLKNEGIPSKKIFFVGNCMIDSLKKFSEKAVQKETWVKYGLSEKKYILATLHRPSNVDDRVNLEKLAKVMSGVAEKMPIIFPVHPRTREHIGRWGIKISPAIRLTDPLAYTDFLGLMAKSALVLTDSGGIQEETSALKIPCITLRENTERPVTLTEGTNVLAGVDAKNISIAISRALSEETRKCNEIPLWDGFASKRIVDILVQKLK